MFREICEVQKEAVKMNWFAINQTMEVLDNDRRRRIAEGGKKTVKAADIIKKARGLA